MSHPRKGQPASPSSAERVAMILKRTMFLAAAWLAMAGIEAPASTPASGLRSWRLDCGAIAIPDLRVFSDTYLHAGLSRTLVDSCYLIKHGSRYLLWDSGLPGELAGGAAGRDPSMALKERIVPQLARLGLKPEQITFLGLS